MAPTTDATYQDMEGNQSLLVATPTAALKYSMLTKVLCAVAVAATVGIAYTAGVGSAGHGAVTSFASSSDVDGNFLRSMDMQESAYGDENADEDAFGKRRSKPSKQQKLSKPKKQQKLRTNVDNVKRLGEYKRGHKYNVVVQKRKYPFVCRKTTFVKKGKRLGKGKGRPNRKSQRAYGDEDESEGDESEGDESEGDESEGEEEEEEEEEEEAYGGRGGKKGSKPKGRGKVKKFFMTRGKQVYVCTRRSSK